MAHMGVHATIAPEDADKILENKQNESSEK
jgi:hypothetical protein